MSAREVPHVGSGGISRGSGRQSREIGQSCGSRQVAFYANMDIMLRGEIDGVDAASQILVSVDIPIIFLTAYANEDTLQPQR